MNRLKITFSVKAKITIIKISNTSNVPGIKEKLCPISSINAAAAKIIK